MVFFSDSLSRLKHALRVSKDQEVAEALGLSKTAFSERKKRESFPIKEVFELAQQKPELGLDPDWIVTGTSIHTETQDRTEEILLQHYRLMNSQTAKMFLKIAATMSGAAEISSDEITRKLGAASSRK